MSVLKFSREAVMAFKEMSKYTRRGNREAMDAIDRQTLAGGATSHEQALAARIYAEDWRNGWLDGGRRGRTTLQNALAFANRAVDLARTPDDKWYAYATRAYVLKYAARSVQGSWGPVMGQAVEDYDKARQALERLMEADPKSTAHRSNYRDLMIDRAETFVYLDIPSYAVAEMERVIGLWSKDKEGPVPDPWHYWAYAFALFHVGRHLEGWKCLQPLVDAAGSNNDMRLVYAANLIGDSTGSQAEAARNTVAAFHKSRKPLAGMPAADREPDWTVRREIGHGAFRPNGEGEQRWRQVLKALKFEEGKDPDPQFPSHDPMLPQSLGFGPLPSAAPASRAKTAAKTKTGAKAPARRTAKKKTAKKPAPRASAGKTSAKKAASRKAARKPSRRR
jgi:hypothetical protein